MNMFIDSKLKAFGLNANEVLVYSAIAAVSKEKGWYVSYESLTNHLPCVISTRTVERAIRRLTDLKLIERRRNALFATKNCLPPADKLSPTTDKLSVTNRQIVPAKPTNCPLETDKLSPIYNKEYKEKEEGNTITSCDTIATTIPPTPSSIVKNSDQATQPLCSFDQLLAAFKSLNPNVNPSPKVIDAARKLWDNLPDDKQQQILDAVQKGTWNKDNLEWFISDFKFREPFNYLGKKQETGYSYYFAWHNGERGLYTKQDVDAFQMSNPEHFMDL